MPTIKQQITELKREFHTRRRVFPKWVASGRLEQAEADRRCARLEAAIESLHELQALRAPSLFDDNS